MIRSWQWGIFSSLIVLSMCISLGQEVHCHMRKEMCTALDLEWPCNIFVSRENFNKTQEGTAWYPICPKRMFNDDALNWWKIMNTILFTIELLARIFAEQRDFFAEENVMKWWNILDACLWMISAVDLVSDDPLIQVLRVGRLFRAMRLFEIFPELRAMFYSCFACSEALMWAFFLLASFMYMVGIYFMEVALFYLRNSSDSLDKEYKLNLASNWNGLWITLMSLVYSITGGLSWQPLAEPFYHMGSWGDFHGLVFTSFIAVSTIGLLNILVGIFVQKASDVGKVSRDAAIAQAYLEQMDSRRDMEYLFEEFDKDNNSRITADEIERGLEQPRIQAYFHLLDIDVADKDLFLNHFNENFDSGVSKDEFVDGCQLLQGKSRPLREMKRLLDEIKSLKELKKQHVR
jgi:hypothetical protein